MSWCAHLYGDCKQQPAKNLHGVVCTGEVLEQKAAGDFIALFARLAQVGQDQMAPAQQREGTVRSRLEASEL